MARRIGQLDDVGPSVLAQQRPLRDTTRSGDHHGGHGQAGPSGRFDAQQRVVEQIGTARCHDDDRRSASARLGAHQVGARARSQQPGSVRDAHSPRGMSLDGPDEVAGVEIRGGTDQQQLGHARSIGGSPQRAGLRVALISSTTSMSPSI